MTQAATVDAASTKDHRSVSFNVSRDQLRRALRATMLAVSTEETRYYLNGVFFQTRHGGCHLVSTDGHRLVQWKLQLPAEVADDHDVIVSRESVAALLKWLRHVTGLVTIELQTWRQRSWVPGNKDYTWSDKTAASLADAGRFNLFTCTTIDGCFPDWQRVLPPSDCPIMVGIDGKALKQALEAFRIEGKGSDHHAFKIAADGAGKAKLTASFSVPVMGEKPHVLQAGKRRGQTVMRRQVVDTKQWTAEREIDCDASQPIEFAFNRHYVAELIGLARKTVCFAGTEPHHVWRLILDGSSTPEVVVMPCRA